MRKLFMIDSPDELSRFIASKSGQEGITWEVSDDRVYFRREKQEMKEIPSYKMIELSLDYATELNRIV